MRNQSCNGGSHRSQGVANRSITNLYLISEQMFEKGLPGNLNVIDPESQILQAQLSNHGQFPPSYIPFCIATAGESPENKVECILLDHLTVYQPLKVGATGGARTGFVEQNFRVARYSYIFY